MTTDLHRALLGDGRQSARLGKQHPLVVSLTFQARVAWQVWDAATDASMDHAVAHHRIWSIHAMPDDHGEASVVAPDVDQISSWRWRLLATPYDDRPVVQPLVRAEGPHLMDGESE
jgi:hypothetical protein